MQRRKILFTGGHAATTSIAVYEELIRRYSKDELDIYFAGSRWAFEGDRLPTLEYEYLDSIGFKFIDIPSGRFQRKFTKYTVNSFIKFFLSIFKSFWTVVRVRPSLVFSFGGFSSFWIVIAAKLLFIPVIVHDQTSVAGRSNRLNAVFADKVLVSRKTSMKYFPKNKTIFTGNPVMTQIKEIEEKKELSKPPVILVMGGSRGSAIINEVLFQSLDRLVKKYKVVHLVGKKDYEKAKNHIKNNNLSDKYVYYDRVNPLEIDNLYREADLVVSRSGANTVSETIVAGRPAIFIPIPWSYLNEQQKNAEHAEELGIAIILKQADLSPNSLCSAVDLLVKRWNKMTRQIDRKNNPDVLASSNIVDIIDSYL